MNGFSGAVLAGGRSSRFGSDKARYVYRGKTLLTWALESLSGADERFVIAHHPYELDLPIYPDLVPGGGPLSGLHAALTYAARDWVALAGCDLPFLTPAYWSLLWGQRAGVEAVIVHSEGGRLEPLAALYHRALLPAVTAQLKAGDLRVGAVAQNATARVLPWEEVRAAAHAAVLTNANYLGDLP